MQNLTKAELHNWRNYQKKMAPLLREQTKNIHAQWERQNSQKCLCEACNF